MYYLFTWWNYFFYFLFQPVFVTIFSEWFEWPNLLGDNDGFWRHEWDAHGKCAYELFHDQATYFHKTVILKLTNNIQSWLSSKNIMPDVNRDFTVRSIKQTIKTNFDAYPQLSCTTVNEMPLQLLEVRLCFNEEGIIPKNCPRRDRNYGGSRTKIKWYT
jgi:ribonuclease I